MLRSDEMRRRNREISALCKNFEPVMYEVAETFGWQACRAAGLAAPGGLAELVPLRHVLGIRRHGLAIGLALGAGRAAGWRCFTQHGGVGLVAGREREQRRGEED